MVSLLALAALIFAVLLFNVMARLRLVERELAELRGQLQPEPASMPPAEGLAVQPRPLAAEPPPRRVARVVRSNSPVEPLPVEPSYLEPESAPEPAPAFGGFENLVGGRLPIWIGGAALILAAFFLVRYSIESGLLGPGARAVLGALFGLALLGASEAARRLPATASDPRIGQALAGAGIAILYGTLYMAAELHGLIAALPAFVLMIAITAAALGLSLRHGPPTAIMGLIGGFAAPLVTGIDAAGVAPLLVYLALFTAGLFALAIHRGWLWLALAATGGGLIWPLALIAVVEGGQLPFVGLFVLTLAFAATLALPRAGGANRLLRLAPLVTGLLQLLLIAPRMEFSPLAWALYTLLAAAALWLGWRDTRLSIGAGAALGLALTLLAIALGGGDAANAPLAALAFTALFGGAGHALARREPDGRTWTAIALGGTAAPLLLVLALMHDLPAPWLRALLAALAALACAYLSWRFRAEASSGGERFSLGLAGGGAVAALLAVVAAGQVAETGWIGAAIAAVAAAFAAWAGHVRDQWSARIALIAFASAALLPALVAILPAAGAALAGATLPYPYLPTVGDAIREAGLPGLLLFAAGALARPAAGIHSLRTALALASAGAGIALYVLAKQPLAIATAERFVALGLLERAAFTHLLLGAGCALLAFAPRLRPIALGLIGLGLFRFVWFDLLLLNPLIEPQRVGAIALLNLAALHPALIALWLHLAAQRIGEHERLTRGAAMACVIVAVCGAVRQFAQGTLIAGADVSRGETYLYSAALLALAAIWLWRGIATGSRAIRIAALALLTLVTLKVFLVDAAALEGILRILSFLGLGLALIAIGWAYGRFLGRSAAPAGSQGSR